MIRGHGSDYIFGIGNFHVHHCLTKVHLYGDACPIASRKIIILFSGRFSSCPLWEQICATLGTQWPYCCSVPFTVGRLWRTGPWLFCMSLAGLLPIRRVQNWPITAMKWSKCNLRIKGLQRIRSGATLVPSLKLMISTRTSGCTSSGRQAQGKRLLTTTRFGHLQTPSRTDSLA